MSRRFFELCGENGYNLLVGFVRETEVKVLQNPGFADFFLTVR
jgi:hypothetical protein